MAYHNLVVFCVAVTDVVHVTLLSECFSRAALHCAELPCLDTIGKEDRCALVLHIPVWAGLSGWSRKRVPFHATSLPQLTSGEDRRVEPARASTSVEM